MTLGQILFYSGIGLLAATGIVGILFLIIKPRYTPESPVYQRMGQGQGGVPPMYNGYPTDPLRRGGQTGAGPAGWQPYSGPIPPSGQMQGGMPPVGGGAVQPPQETLPLSQGGPPQR